MANTIVELNGWKLVVDDATPTVPIVDAGLTGAGGNMVQDNFRELSFTMDLSGVTGSDAGTVVYNASGGTLDFDFLASGSTNLLSINGSTAQVGVGTSSPATSAILDITSTTKALLLPRLTTTQQNAVASPTAGLLIFNTTLSKLSVYTGAAWETVTSA